MRVVIVGCGRIGCGYLAPLFRSAGWEVVLGARTDEIAARIRRSGFGVRLTKTPGSASGGGLCMRVDGIGAVAVGSSSFDEAVSRADLVCVSVGVTNVDSLAPQLAKALASVPPERTLDVWVVENADCASALERGVRETAAAAGLTLPRVGFAGAVATVAVAHGSWRETVQPEFVGDAARTLWVDTQRLRTPIPAVPGVCETECYKARLREKLYVFNAGHAICAYLGWLRGHATIAEGAADPRLRPVIAGCLLESRRALLARYPSLGSDVHGPVAEALERFGDSELADPISRVARQPIRKLSPRDRLLGPARLIQRATGQVPAYFALGAAGALLYRRDDDEQTISLRADLRELGVMSVLRRVCGLAVDDPLAEAIASRYRGFVVTPTKTLFPPVHVAEPAVTPFPGLAPLPTARL